MKAIRFSDGSQVIVNDSVGKDIVEMMGVLNPGIVKVIDYSWQDPKETYLNTKHIVWIRDLDKNVG